MRFAAPHESGCGPTLPTWACSKSAVIWGTPVVIPTEARRQPMTHLRHRLCITEVEMMLICAGTKSNSSPPPRPYGVRVLSRAPVPMRCVFWDLTGEAALEERTSAAREPPAWRHTRSPYYCRHACSVFGKGPKRRPACRATNSNRTTLDPVSAMIAPSTLCPRL